MARVIIRFSLDGDDGRVGTATKKRLEANSWVNIGTSTWQVENLEPSVMFAVLDDVLGPIRELPDSDGRRLDHLWIYVDKTTPPPAS